MQEVKMVNWNAKNFVYICEGEIVFFFLTEEGRGRNSLETLNQMKQKVNI